MAAVGEGRIEQVDFHLAGTEEIRRAAAVEVQSYELYTAPGGPPVVGGVYDTRMGTTDHATLCLTCGAGKVGCLGHPGVLNLRYPLVQPIGANEVRRWLRVCCHACGAALVDLARQTGPAAGRLMQAAQAATEGKACACGAVQPRVERDESDGFSILRLPAGPRAPGAGAGAGAPPGARFYPWEIQAILGRIPDQTIRALGRDPRMVRALVLDAIRIPPNTVRPGVKSYGDRGTSYHDLTNLIQHLVRRNSEFEGGEEGEKGRRNGVVQELLYRTLVVGSPGAKATQGGRGKLGMVAGSRALLSLLTALAKKAGRIRGNLLGKRVFLVARSTISGNSALAIDEVGVPLSVALSQVVEETVQEFNRERLTAAYLNGKRQYPGCKWVRRRATGEVHDVAGLGGVPLELGDLVGRDPVDGDVILFNRQPTLERSSIGGHEMVILHGTDETLQMNVSACSFYNADFDGDQMNGVVPHGPAARAEAWVLSHVRNHVTSTKNGSPTVGQVQDAILGAKALTREGARLDKPHAMQVLARAVAAGIPPPRFDGAPGGRAWEGRELVGAIFAGTPFDLERATSSSSEVFAPYVPVAPRDAKVVFRRGRLLQGVLDKATVGEKSVGGVYDLVCRQDGPAAAIRLVFALQQAALQYLNWRGFSIAAADLLPPPPARAAIRGLVAGARRESLALTARLLRGEVVPPIGSTVLEFHERLQLNALKVPDSEVLRRVLEGARPETNGLYQMVVSGSKGNAANIINLGGAIGQTTINGERLREQFALGRTLPCFPRCSPDPEARGFVGNSYILGMTSSEFAAQSENGRSDLIAKALTTASTGYFARKGVMNNQSVLVDAFLRATKGGQVVMLLYGGTGFDPRAVEVVRLGTLGLDDRALEARAGLDVRAWLGLGPGPLPPAAARAQAAADRAVEAVRADRDAFRAEALRAEAASGEAGGGLSAEFRSPVDVRRLVEGVRAQAGREAPPPDAAGLLRRLAAVEALAAGLPYAYANAALEARGAPLPPQYAAGVARVGRLVRAELPPAALAGLSDAEVAGLAATVRVRLAEALVAPGSAVGVLAAQALSEPLTQYMLDSHHRSVSGGTTKSGLVRVQEIYGAKGVAGELAPRMLLPLRGLAGGPAERLAAAQAVANRLELVPFRSLVLRYDLLFEPPGALRYPPFAADAAWLAEFRGAHPLLAPEADTSSWCLRFVLDRRALVLKALGLGEVVRALRGGFEGRLFLAHAAEGAPELALRVWLRAGAFRRGGAGGEAEASAFAGALLEAPVRGVGAVRRAEVKAVSRGALGPGGGLLREEGLAVETEGTSLYQAFLQPEVDAPRATTSSIGDIYRLFGVAAAAAAIVRETRAFMAGNAPNAAHLYVYALEMTRTGIPTSVERGGLSLREPKNVLLRAAYGAPAQVLSEAALTGARSPVYGVAAPQLLGATPALGSAFSEFSVDPAFVAARLKTLDRALEEL